jgi:intracellular sulfur oxidation DsrE/DsrF family protein
MNAMRCLGFTAGAVLIVLAGGISPASGVNVVESEGVHIDVPVRLSEARVVFNLDHLAFDGDQPIGLQFMNVMVEQFRSSPVKWQIIGIFHGPNGYMALDDTRYNQVRHWKHGNPYKDQIAALRAAGVQVELCAETMRLNGWRNEDILPGVKVNSGANFRLIELIQQGFVEIHP